MCFVFNALRFALALIEQQRQQRVPQQQQQQALQEQLHQDAAKDWQSKISHVASHATRRKTHCALWSCRWGRIWRVGTREASRRHREIQPNL
jgi:hypothetical protein